jgi:hypothetical protein
MEIGRHVNEGGNPKPTRVVITEDINALLDLWERGRAEARHVKHDARALHAPPSAT